MKCPNCQQPVNPINEHQTFADGIPSTFLCKYVPTIPPAASESLDNPMTLERTFTATVTDATMRKMEVEVVHATFAAGLEKDLAATKAKLAEAEKTITRALTGGSIFYSLTKKLVSESECYCVKEGVATKEPCAWCEANAFINKADENVVVSTYLTEVGKLKVQRDAALAECERLRTYAGSQLFMSDFQTADDMRKALNESVAECERAKGELAEAQKIIACNNPSGAV